MAIMGVTNFKNKKIKILGIKTKQNKTKQLMFKNKVRDLMVIFVKRFRGYKEEYSQNESIV